jgi:hypothetical protein
MSQYVGALVDTACAVTLRAKQYQRRQAHRGGTWASPSYKLGDPYRCIGTRNACGRSVDVQRDYQGQYPAETRL